jgi:ABC-type dipeptide/oligopeptide/nickel transport system ATPase component
MSKSFDIVCGAIKHRINVKDKSYMLLIVGEMGSGKSLAGVAIACRVDPTFKDSPRIVYTVPEFLEAVLKAKKGQAVIFDEAGVGVPSREWHTEMNRIMSIITQILRFKNICVIFTTPNIRLLDINVREAMNGFIKPRYIDDAHQVNVCTFKTIIVNDNGEVVKRNFIYYDGKNGAAGEIIDPLRIPRPDPDIEEYYKKISFDMKNSKLRELKQSINEEATTPQAEQALKNKANVCVKLLEHLRSTHTWDEVAAISGMSARQLQNWMKA